MKNDQEAAGSAPSPFQGHVDGWDGARLRGWAFDSTNPTRRLDVEVLQGGQRILLLKADRFRPDLAQAGLGDGCCSFDVPLPVTLFDAPTVMLQLRPHGSGQDLTGSPVTARNPSAALDAASLSALSEKIAGTAQAAQAPEALDTLVDWLREHHDLVYARQAALLQAAIRRDVWFAETFTEKGTLPDVLHGAARAVVAQYDTLSHDSGAHPEVTVIIPVYGQFGYTYRCVQSLLAHPSRATFEVIVMDDASADETMFANLVMFGDIRIVRNTRNLGFLKSVNAAAKLARGRLLFLLNNDTEVQEGWLDALVDTFARDPAVGIAGSKLVYPSGLLQEAGGIVWRDGSAMNWGRNGDPHDPQYCYMRDADYVSGAALMIERALFDAVGGLTEAYAPAYYEDTDLCFKARAAGRRVVVQPQSKVVHHEGVTSGTDVSGPGVKRYQRVNYRTFTQQWFDVLQSHGLSDSDPAGEIERGVTKRALFIDDTVPTPDQDAGSNAAMSYMLALQRLGYKVSFVSDNVLNVPRYTGQLEAAGIRCYYSPYTHAVTDVLKNEAAAFDVFFVHRFANMQKYLGLIRERFPKAQVVYCVADLHHLRAEREAEIKQDETLRQAARDLRQKELAMVQAADSVVVHSSFERDLVHAFDPAVQVHAIPWAVVPQPTAVPFTERQGIAFIGGYNHPPNVDAALWLVDAILPLVHAQAPDIECLLIGSQMPDSLRTLERPGLRIVGHLETLHPTLQTLRLMVAPLRYGAGLKGKVLTSLAAGLPCVATPCAVEGMNLPEACNALVAETAEALAERILLAYRDEALNRTIGQAGLDYIAQACAPAHVDARLQAAATRTAARKPRSAVRATAAPRRAAPANSDKPGRTRAGESRTPG